MKVLFIIPEYPPSYGGGIATFYSQLIPFICRSGVHCTVVVGSCLGAYEEYFADANLSVVPLNQQRAKELRSSFKYLSLSPDLSAHLAAAFAAFEQFNGGCDFDLIECTDWGFYFVPWILCPSSPPVVVRLHASEGQIAFHDPHSCPPLSSALFQLVESVFLTKPSCLLTYGLSNQTYWKEYLHREVGFSYPPLSLPHRDYAAIATNKCGLVVGRLQSWKGPQTLLDAMRLLNNDSPNIDWYGRVVTSPSAGMPLDRFLQGKYPDLWGKQFKHFPPQPPIKIKQIQANANFIIVPSDWDVFNYTAAEAMAIGQVVICSTGAGASSLIVPGINGFTFQAGNSESLASAIHSVLRLSTEERRVLGRNARETIANHLNPQSIAEQTLGFYSQAITTGNVILNKGNPFVRIFSPDLSKSSSRSLINDLDRIDLKTLIKYLATRISQKVLRPFSS